MCAQPAEIAWNHNFDEVFERAKAEGRDVLLDFSAAPM